MKPMFCSPSSSPYPPSTPAENSLLSHFLRVRKFAVKRSVSLLPCVSENPTPAVVSHLGFGGGGGTAGEVAAPESTAGCGLGSRFGFVSCADTRVPDSANSAPAAE